MDKKKKLLIVSILFLLIFIVLIIFIVFKKDKTYTIVFDTDGGSVISNIKVKENEQIKITEKTVKDGYTFAGWLNEEGFILIGENKLNSDIKLKALWIKDEVETVKVKVNIDDYTTDIIAEKGKNIILPISHVKDGYTFAGWIDDNGNIISNNIILNESINIKARWIKNNSKTYNIKVNTDGGYIIDDIIVESNKPIVLPVNPTKNGYIFAGWIDDNGNEINKTTIVKGNIKIKALWKEPYTCPDDCTPVEDGSKCTKIVNQKITTKVTCPNGYTEKNGLCLDYSSKYHATNTDTSPFWKCNNSSEYMYTEEDGAGGAFMWCVKKADKITTSLCPSGYTKDKNSCTKIETISCKAN